MNPDFDFMQGCKLATEVLKIMETQYRFPSPSPQTPIRKYIKDGIELPADCRPEEVLLAEMTQLPAFIHSYKELSYIISRAKKDNIFFETVLDILSGADSHIHHAYLISVDSAVKNHKKIK
jgi:hypothetical protein